MKDNQVKDKFIELRVQGLSYARIAEELNVSKQTLIRWADEYRNQIRNLKAIELEAQLEKYTISKRKRIEFLSDQFRTIKEELQKRNFDNVQTDKLLGFLYKYAGILKKEVPEMRFADESGFFFDAP